MAGLYDENNLVRSADGRIAIVGPDGRSALVPLGELDAAIRDYGFRLQTKPEFKERELEAKYGDHPGTAAVLGALRAATFGLSDVGLGLDGGEFLRETTERNKGASIAGEVAGYLAPVGAGAGIARVGTAAGEAAGAGIRGLAARGATEGVLAAGQQTVSQAALSEDPISAETMISNLGSNILYGAGIGGGVGALAGVLGHAAAATKARAQAYLGRIEAETAAAASNWQPVPGAAGVGPGSMDTIVNRMAAEAEERAAKLPPRNLETADTNLDLDKLRRSPAEREAEAQAFAASAPAPGSETVPGGVRARDRAPRPQAVEPVPAAAPAPNDPLGGRTYRDPDFRARMKGVASERPPATLADRGPFELTGAGGAGEIPRGSPGQPFSAPPLEGARAPRSPAQVEREYLAAQVDLAKVEAGLEKVYGNKAAKEGLAGSKTVPPSGETVKLPPEYLEVARLRNRIVALAESEPPLAKYKWGQEDVSVPDRPAMSARMRGLMDDLRSAEDRLGEISSKPLPPQRAYVPDGRAGKRVAQLEAQQKAVVGRIEGLKRELDAFSAPPSNATMPGAEGFAKEAAPAPTGVPGARPRPGFLGGAAPDLSETLPGHIGAPDTLPGSPEFPSGSPEFPSGSPAPARPFSAAPDARQPAAVGSPPPARAAIAPDAVIAAPPPKPSSPLANALAKLGGGGGLGGMIGGHIGGALGFALGGALGHPFLGGGIGRVAGRMLGGGVSPEARAAIARHVAQLGVLVSDGASAFAKGGARVAPAAVRASSTTRSSAKLPPATDILRRVSFSPEIATQQQQAGMPKFKTPASTSIGQAFRQRHAELASAMSNIAAVRARVADFLVGVHAMDPKLAQQGAELAVKRIQYAWEKAPKNPGLGSPLDGWKRWERGVSDSEIATWSRVLSALEDPVGRLLGELNAGRLHPATVQTVKDVYPEQFSRVQTALLETLSERRETLPYNKRVQLSILFDVPLDSTLTPEKVAFFQSQYTDEPGTEGGNKAPPAGNPKTPEATSAQRLASS